jgi:hypothetical protein
MSQSDHLPQSYKFRFGQFTLIPLHERTVKTLRRRSPLKRCAVGVDPLFETSVRRMIVRDA